MNTVEVLERLNGSCVETLIVAREVQERERVGNE